MTARPTREQLKARLGELDSFFDQEGEELWEEARDAYHWFLEPGLSAPEAARRWTLVVHLVHNFKSQVRIRLPATKWPTLEGKVLSPVPKPQEAPQGVQQEIIASVNERFLQGKGVAVPIRSALLALIRPKDHAIIDRWSFTALAGATGGSNPPAGFGTELGGRYPDDSDELIPSKFQQRDYDLYLTGLKKLAEHTEETLRTCERAMYGLGQLVGRKEGRSWGGYRESIGNELRNN